MRLAGLWGPVVAYMALIFLISAQPKAPLPSQLSDKQGHSIGYMGLAVTVARALAGGLSPGTRLPAAAAAWGMCPDPAREAERVVIEREHTMARLEERLRRISARLSDDEVLRLVRAMLNVRAKRDGAPQ